MISEPTYTSKGSSSFSFIAQSIDSFDNLSIIGVLIAISLVGVVIATEKNKIRLVFETLLSDKSLNQNFRDKTTFTNRSTLLLLGNYILCVSLLSLASNGIFSFSTESTLRILLVSTGVVTALFIVKRTIILATGFAIGHYKETQEYLFNHTIFTLAAGISLLPILVLLNFMQVDSKMIILTTFVFLLLFIGVRLIKSTVLALKHQAGSLFYIFLYICSLEILPLIVLYKAFVSKLA